MSKYCDEAGAEEIFFISGSEQTLPSYSTIEEEIEKYIPTQNKTNWWFEIKHPIERVGNSSYKIRLYYILNGGKVYEVACMIGVLVGIIVACTTASSKTSWFLNALVGSVFLGALFMAIGGFIARFIPPTYQDAKYNAEKACDRIVLGLKELERRTS